MESDLIARHRTGFRHAGQEGKRGGAHEFGRGPEKARKARPDESGGRCAAKPPRGAAGVSVGPESGYWKSFQSWAKVLCSA